MDDLLELTEKPVAKEVYMIAGWRQWADAGATSSALPQYLIDHLGARKIGRIKSGGFYLYQLPMTQHFLRPEVKFEEGYRKELRQPRNEIFYAGDERKGWSSSWATSRTWARSATPRRSSTPRRS